jgi:predicted glycosyltransferase
MDTVSGRTIPRAMFYPHVRYGPGHLGRTLALARHFRGRHLHDGRNVAFSYVGVPEGET